MTQPPRRVMLPERATPGQVIEVRLLIQHPMTTGYTRDSGGCMQARRIIHRVEVTWGGEPIFDAELGPGIAANPFLRFFTRATASGEVVITWHDDNGERYVERRRVEVG
jgi:sulfur-oxidizing protein SoxZ